MPVDVLARRRDTIDMATTKASNRYLPGWRASVSTDGLVGALNGVDPVPAVWEQRQEPVGEGADTQLEGEEDGEEEVEVQQEAAKAGPAAKK